MSCGRYVGMQVVCMYNMYNMYVLMSGVFGSARSTSDTAGGDRSCLEWNSCPSSVRYQILHS